MDIRSASSVPLGIADAGSWNIYTFVGFADSILIFCDIESHNKLDVNDLLGGVRMPKRKLCQQPLVLI